MINFDFYEYQKQANDFAKYPDKSKNIFYPGLGLAGEAGEVADKIKRIMRDDGGELTEERRKQIIYELGDVLWYVAALCYEIREPMANVAIKNLEKLGSRRDRGVLSGDGDDR